MKLIDKDALVAEIKKHLEYANNGILYAQTGIEKGLKKYERDLNAWQHCQSMCKNILSFIDTLEVKECGAKSGIVQKDLQIVLDDGTYIDLDPSMQLKPSFSVKGGEKVKVVIIKED